MTRPDELKQAIEHAEACMADRDRWVAMLDVAVGSPYLRTLIDAAKQADAWREALTEIENSPSPDHWVPQYQHCVDVARAALPAPEPKGA